MYYMVTPLADELLSSWLIRSSILNGTDPIGFTESIWYNERVWTKDIDRYFSKDKIQFLQEHTSPSLTQIYYMTLEPIYTKLTNPQTINPKKQWQYIIPIGIRNRTKTNGLHFCPLCLKESIPYLKKQWRLSWNCICEKHQIMLELHCHECNRCFSPHLIDYTNIDFTKCQYCNASLTDIKYTHAKESVFDFQNFLNISLKQNIILGNKYPIIDNKVFELFATVRGFMLFFRNLAHSDVYSSFRDYLFEQMGYQYKPIEKDMSLRQSSIDALPVKQRYQLLDMVTCIFQFNLPEVILMLTKADVSKQLFTKSITLYSPTLIHISNSLKNRPKTIKKKVIKTVSAYQPKSKYEVEALMEEIRPYL
ncbi:MAG TPA: hypothetical protein EYH42_06215 [Sulfurovum sp.]|nr:hypothetical protein [Sulfurovum sp.]